MVEKVTDQLSYWPRDIKLYSSSGCKRVAQKIDLIVEEMEEEREAGQKEELWDSDYVLAFWELDGGYFWSILHLKCPQENMGCDANIVGNIEPSINNSSHLQLCRNIAFQLNDLRRLNIYTDLDWSLILH